MKPAVGGHLIIVPATYITSKSRPSDKRRGRSSRPWDNGGPVLPKKFFRLFGPQFGPKIRGGAGPPGPLPWIRHLPDVFNWTWEFNHRFTFIYYFPFVFQFTPKLLSSWKFLEVYHSNISSSWFYLYFKNRLTITMKILKTRINFISYLGKLLATRFSFLFCEG